MSEAAEPWDWLLGRASDGAWRYAGGRGQPTANPKLLLLRRAVAHPKAAFERVIEAIAAADPSDGLRWVELRRDRRDWLLLFRPDPEAPDERRYVFGLEFVSRDELGLWFVSGFREPNALPSDAYAEYEPGRALPRLAITDAPRWPLARWLAQAAAGELTFTDEAEQLIGETVACDRSALIAASVALAEPAETDPARADPARADPARADPARADPASPPALVILCDRGAHRLLRPLGRIVIGRHPGCDVSCEERSVSARHAHFEFGPGGVSVTDLGSRNGTMLNGHRLTPRVPCALPELCALKLGNTQVLVRSIACETSETPLESLFESGRLSRSGISHSARLAEANGISPAEQLILDGLLSPEEWVRHQRPGAFPRRSNLGPWLVSLSGAALAAALAWWAFVGPLA